MTSRFVSLQTIYRILTAVVLSSIMMAGCRSQGDAEGPPTAVPSPTPWPTLKPVFTPNSSAVIDNGNQPEEGPHLVDLIRTEILADATAIYPLKGTFEHPVRIEVVVLSGDLDPKIIINNLEGDQLAEVNTGAEGQPEVIGQFIFPGDGYYELGIASVSGTGEVGISIYELPASEVNSSGVFSSFDEELSGTMTHPASYHTFRLPLERGTRVDIIGTAVSSELDLLFEVYTPDGKLVAARDDNLGIDPVLWNFMPDQTGVYTVVLSNFDENGGDYVLSVHPSLAGGEAAIGERTDLELQGFPRRSTWLTFSGQALNAIEVEARPISPGVDIVITVTDPYGNEIVSVNQTEAGEDEVITLAQLPFDGEYQIEFLTVGESGEIDYYIRPVQGADLEAGGRTAPGAKRHSGEMDGPGTVIAYSFAAQGGDLIGVDAHATNGTELDLGFTLLDPEGHVVFSADDVVGKDPIVDRIELLSSGRYILLLWNFADTTGTFDLFITNPEAPDTTPDE